MNPWLKVTAVSLILLVISVILSTVGPAKRNWYIFTGSLFTVSAITATVALIGYIVLL